MTPPEPTQRGTILDDLLKWSEDRPHWQRDALRRILTQGGVDEVAMQLLAKVCRHTHGISMGEPPGGEIEYLAASHIPASVALEEPITLVSVGKLKGVNRLPSSQAITFGASPGLSVVYGDNGVGKSGYARVLKKACRSRGALPTIRPNAFGPRPTEPASGEIVFSVGAQSHNAQWIDGKAAHGSLSRVFIFDTVTAQNYLSQDGPASFTPFGLDILPKLSKVCDGIREGIKAETDSIKREIAFASATWKPGGNTAVGRLIASLSAKTADQEIDAHSGLVPEQKRRLHELGELLRADPKQKARETRAASARLLAFAEAVKSGWEKLSAQPVSDARKLCEEANLAAETARAFAEGNFDAAYLPDTGGAFWRSLWDAAREYSQSIAYPGKEFPSVEVDAKCVLCQEALTPQAAKRLKRFNTFVTDRSQHLSNEAEKKVRTTAAKYVALPSLEGEYRKAAADLSAASQELAEGARLFSTACDAARETIVGNFAKRAWDDVAALPGSPEESVRVVATRLADRAVEEERSVDPASRAALENERDELSSREWLGSMRAEVGIQVGRLRRVLALERCGREAATTSITAKNSEFTKRVVTDAFCDRFKAELAALGMRTVGVKLQDIAGAKGETKFGLRLEPASPFTVDEVASEGEQRCIALAAFLAELSQAGHLSALVFDDPVSSLDHWHRDRIARRLAAEAKVRQVIVFTHDAVFLNDLCSHADQVGAAGSYSHILWNGTEPGHCYPGLPWECKRPEERVDYLEKWANQLEAKWGPRPTPEQTADMRNAYSWLRQTVERTVEKVVFSDVVFRYRSYVNLKNLRQVVGFSEIECAEVERMFKRCCDVTDAHDAAQAKQAPPPDPKDLKNDIAAFKTLLNSMRARQKATR